MNETPKPPRPALPRDAFRAQRISSDPPLAPKPVVITPHYDDQPKTQASSSATPLQSEPHLSHNAVRPISPPLAKPKRGNPRPFDAYGERSSSRPYALRLPDAIDLALRQIAAEERTHPLRIIDRVLYDYLKRIGRLPPSHDA
ncbi:hypothetical protein [Mesorhizobium silamurunense]|uniref:hypothetical protein n=1 Tax=Mesorhizobium silamurunense TaxID=499528 RepID=UPI0017839F64|nr:hypothetical protein [Mesorhizobium silamurunense]